MTHKTKQNRKTRSREKVESHQGRLGVPLYLLALVPVACPSGMSPGLTGPGRQLLTGPGRYHVIFKPGPSAVTQLFCFQPLCPPLLQNCGFLAPDPDILLTFEGSGQVSLCCNASIQKRIWKQITRAPSPKPTADIKGHSFGSGKRPEEPCLLQSFQEACCPDGRDAWARLSLNSEAVVVSTLPPFLRLFWHWDLSEEPPRSPVTKSSGNSRAKCVRRSSGGWGQPGPMKYAERSLLHESVHSHVLILMKSK